MKVEKVTQQAHVKMGLNSFSAWLKQNSVFRAYTNRLIDEYGFNIMKPLVEALNTNEPRNLFAIIKPRTAKPPKAYNSWDKVIGLFETAYKRAGYEGMVAALEDEVIYMTTEPVTTIRWETADVIEWLCKQGAFVPFFVNMKTYYGRDVIVALDNLLTTENPSYVIETAFEWDNTPEGLLYWQEVSQKWKTFVKAYEEIIKAEEASL